MINDEIHDELLMDLEETLEGQGYVYMYDFAWILRGYELGLDAAMIEAASHKAYLEFVSRHPLRLMWTVWPKDIEGAWPAEPGTELDFDLDPDGPVDEPMLILVPVDG